MSTEESNRRERIREWCLAHTKDPTVVEGLMADLEPFFALGDAGFYTLDSLDEVDPEEVKRAVKEALGKEPERLTFYSVSNPSASANRWASPDMEETDVYSIMFLLDNAIRQDTERALGEMVFSEAPDQLPLQPSVQFLHQKLNEAINLVLVAEGKEPIPELEDQPEEDSPDRWMRRAVGNGLDPLAREIAFHYQFIFSHPAWRRKKMFFEYLGEYGETMGYSILVSTSVVKVIEFYVILVLGGEREAAERLRPFVQLFPRAIPWGSLVAAPGTWVIFVA